MLLTHETLNWAKQSGWELGFIKMDFGKAYNTLAWRFMFQAIEALSNPHSLINLTKLIFK